MMFSLSIFPFLQGCTCVSRFAAVLCHVFPESFPFIFLPVSFAVWSLFLAGIALALSIQEAFEDGTWYLYEQFAESNEESVSAVTSQLHWFIYNGACLPPVGLWCWMQQLIIPFILEQNKSLSRGPCFLTSGNRRTLVQMRLLNLTLSLLWDKPHPSPADWGKLLAMPWVQGVNGDNKS